MRDLLVTSLGGRQYGIWKDAILSVKDLHELHRIPLSPARIIAREPSANMNKSPLEVLKASAKKKRGQKFSATPGKAKIEQARMEAGQVRLDAERANARGEPEAKDKQGAKKKAQQTLVLSPLAEEQTEPTHPAKNPVHRSSLPYPQTGRSISTYMWYGKATRCGAYRCASPEMPTTIPALPERTGLLNPISYSLVRGYV